MKKFFLCMAAVILVFTGCSNDMPSAVGMIKPTSLTQEQKEIVDLLSTQQDILFFDYDSKQEYTHFDVWVEIYQKGELVEPKAAILSLSDKPRSWNGQLSIAITQKPDYQWRISTKIKDGGMMSTVSELSKRYSSGGSQAFGYATDPIGIKENQEILLYSRLFSTSDQVEFYSDQTYLENPELFSEFEYVHLIKCKFYNEET